MRQHHIMELARVGAQLRVAEIQAEIDTLERFCVNHVAEEARAAAGVTHVHRRTHDVGLRPVHWTQTAEGRRKMSRVQKAAWRRKRREA